MLSRMKKNRNMNTVSMQIRFCNLEYVEGMTSREKEIWVRRKKKYKSYCTIKSAMSLRGDRLWRLLSQKSSKPIISKGKKETIFLFYFLILFFRFVIAFIRLCHDQFVRLLCGPFACVNQLSAGMLILLSFF